MFASDCLVAVLRIESPVPAKPVTTPYPISWLSRHPSGRARSFIRRASADTLPAASRAATSHKPIDALRDHAYFIATPVATTVWLLIQDVDVKQESHRQCN